VTNGEWHDGEREGDGMEGVFHQSTGALKEV
jgi:hypothetical protein